MVTTSRRALCLGTGVVLLFDAMQIDTPVPQHALALIIGACAVALITSRDPSTFALCGFAAMTLRGWGCFAGGSSADTVVRWNILFVAAMPCALSRIAILLQFGLMYGGSLVWKSFDSYMITAHAARSTLFQEGIGQHGGMPFALACHVAMHPWFGRALSRFAWLSEAAACAAAACSVLCAAVAASPALVPSVRASGLTGLCWLNAFILPAAVLAVTGLQIGIAGTLQIGYFPSATLILHLAAVLAARELAGELSEAIELVAPELASSCGLLRQQVASAGGGQRSRTPVAARRRRPDPAQTFQRCFPGVLVGLQLWLFSLPLALPEHHAFELAQWTGLHENWAMFHYPAGAPVMSHRVVPHLRTEDGQLLDGALNQLRCGVDAAGGVSGSHVANCLSGGGQDVPGGLGGTSNWRWRGFWRRVAHAPANSPVARYAAEMVCHAGCKAWLAHRAGAAQEARQPAFGAPVEVTLHHIFYDVPHFYAVADAYASAPDLSASETRRREALRRSHTVRRIRYSAAHGQWGEWPRPMARETKARITCDACPSHEAAAATAAAVAAAKVSNASYFDWLRATQGGGLSRFSVQQFYEEHDGGTVSAMGAVGMLPEEVLAARFAEAQDAADLLEGRWPPLASAEQMRELEERGLLIVMPESDAPLDSLIGELESAAHRRYNQLRELADNQTEVIGPSEAATIHEILDADRVYDLSISLAEAYQGSREMPFARHLRQKLGVRALEVVFTHRDGTAFGEFLDPSYDEVQVIVRRCDSPQQSAHIDASSHPMHSDMVDNDHSGMWQVLLATHSTSHSTTGTAIAIEPADGGAPTIVALPQNRGRWVALRGDVIHYGLAVAACPATHKGLPWQWFPSAGLPSNKQLGLPLFMFAFHASFGDGQTPG